MNIKPEWFTADRIRRLQKLIVILSETPKGIGRNQLLLILKSHLDGPRDELPQLFNLLKILGIANIKGARIWLSRGWLQTANLTELEARRALSELIIQSGFLHTQVRFLHTQIQTSTIHDEHIHAPLRPLRYSAPQLLGLLRSWPDVVGTSFVRLPRSLYLKLEAPWSLIRLPTPDDGTKKVVGSRGEAYSYYYLRLESAIPTAVNWVALDTDTLGYDIEDHSAGFVRIEVKASQQSEVRFYLSNNERKVAQENPSDYQVHFWGEIDLNRHPDKEFPLLRQRGFPIIFEDLTAHLRDGRLKAVPTGYKVTRGQ